MTADVHEQSAMLDRRQTKRRARNLARLPREVIQLVLTALLDAAVHSPAFYSPWDEDPQLAHSNEVFRGLRIGNLAYVMYSVCQSWGRALEDHEVWTRAHQLIDPYDAFGFHYAQWLHLHAHEHTNNRANAPQISPRTDPSAHTFVTLTTQFYCVPCLVNRPLALTQRPQRGYYYPEPHLAHQIVPPANILNHKLRSWLPSTGLGFVLCCKDHIRTEATCAVCLREGSQVNNKSPYEPIVCENEDEHPTLKMNPSASPTLALGWCGSETLGLSGWCAVGAKKDLPDTLRNWNGYAVYPAEGTLRVWNTCASCRTAAIAGVFEACEAGSSTNSAAVKRSLLSTLGGPPQWPYCPGDLRAQIDAYEEFAEGDLASLAQMAQERVWLSRGTRYREWLDNVVRAGRYTEEEAERRRRRARMADRDRERERERLWRETERRRWEEEQSRKRERERTEWEEQQQRERELEQEREQEQTQEDDEADMEEVQVITPRDVDMTATRIDEDELEPESEGEALWDKLQRANAAESEDGTGGMTLLPAPIEVPAEPESEPYSALFAELLNDTDTGVKPNFGDDAMDWVGLPDAEVARIERVTGKRNPFGPQNDVVPQRLHGRDESKPEPEVEEEEAPRMQTVPLPPPEQHRDARQPLVPSHTQTGLSGVQAYPVHHVPTPAHFQTVTVKSSGDRLLDEEEEEEMMMMDESAFEEELEEEVWDDVQEESDSENVANYAEEQHARELALGEWARQRILDGVWTAPYDDERLIQSAAASSLSILSRQQASAINPSPSATSAPRPNTVHAHDRIPTVTLAHALNRAHATSLRGVVLPALQNLVRRLVWLSCGGNLERAQARVRAMVREEPSALDGERGLAEWVLARLGEQRSWRAVVKPKPHHHHHHHHHECHERHDHQHAHAHKHTRTPSNTMSAGSHSTASSGSSGERSESPPSPGTAESLVTAATTPTPSPEPLGALVTRVVPWVPRVEAVFGPDCSGGEFAAPDTRGALDRVFREAIAVLWQTEQSGSGGGATGEPGNGMTCFCGICVREMWRSTGVDDSIARAAGASAQRKDETRGMALAPAPLAPAVTIESKPVSTGVKRSSSERDGPEDDRETKRSNRTASVYDYDHERSGTKRSSLEAEVDEYVEADADVESEENPFDSHSQTHHGHGHERKRQRTDSLDSERVRRTSASVEPVADTVSDRTSELIDDRSAGVSDADADMDEWQVAARDGDEDVGGGDARDSVQRGADGLLRYTDAVGNVSIIPEEEDVDIVTPPRQIGGAVAAPPLLSTVKRVAVREESVTADEASTPAMQADNGEEDDDGESIGDVLAAYDDHRRSEFDEPAASEAR